MNKMIENLAAEKHFLVLLIAIVFLILSGIVLENRPLPPDAQSDGFYESKNFGSGSQKAVRNANADSLLQRAR